MSCNCEHTITRDGTGQLDRYLKALDPDYAPIDDRNIKELLVYTKRYASQIRFYDLPEHSVSDGIPANKVSWREFFSKDISVIAASIGTIDLAQIKKDYDEIRANVELDPKASIFAALADPIIGIAARLESWLELVSLTNPVYGDIMLAINSSLGNQLQKLKALDEGYVFVDAGADLEIDYSQIKNLELWGFDEVIDPDLSVYVGSDDESKIRYAALYLDDIFLSFYGYLTGLVDRSEGYLFASLENYPSHQPHIALFIAFLKLFGIVQEQMNGITERMLNFYYRDVLQLREKPSIPDRVHIIFELAKGVSSFPIKKETELDGGKDHAGLAQIYQTNDEIVVNQAKVLELKTLFIEKSLEVDETGIEVASIKEIYAHPMANSVDGFGRPFEDPYPIWPTFGEKRKSKTANENICEEIEGLKDEFYFKNETRFGFALASPQLFLQGGHRLIQYAAEGLYKLFGPLDFLFEKKNIIKLTTNEGWLTIDTRIDPASTNATSLKDAFGGVFDAPTVGNQPLYFVIEGEFEGAHDELFIFLPMGSAAIVGYDSEIHFNSFTTTHPIMQVLVGPQVSMKEKDLKSLKFNSSFLNVKVGSMNTDDSSYSPNMDGLTVLDFENDAGPIDADKVFDPFTAYANRGKSLYIGSNEIFNKPSGNLSININFAGLDDSILVNQTVNFRMRLRRDGIWQTLKIGGDDDQIFDLTLLDNKQSFYLNRAPLTNYQKYSSDTIKGFIQLRLENPAITHGSSDLFQKMQANAEMLKTSSISISYESLVYFGSEGEIDQVFHIYPFGVLEVYQGRIYSEESQGWQKRELYPLDGLKKFDKFDHERDSLVVFTDRVLLPQFTYTSRYSAITKNNNNIINHKDAEVRVENNYRSATEQVVLSASGLAESVGLSINQYSGEIQEEGLLYIGLENLKPQQTITLLFQFADGSEKDANNDLPPINWSYLSNNEWKPLNEINIISDGTYGFQTTGIVKIEVPKDATDNNTIVTTGLHYFRASVTENSHRIPKLIDVIAQAVEAKFDDRDNDQSHFDCPLPAESIAKLVVSKAEVKTVEQPFSSWNGKAKEVGKEFYVRVSERLRHKGRAINSWDYEHLVLNRFASIYKVKAITHTDPNCLCRSNVLVNDSNMTFNVKYGETPAMDEVELTKIDALLNKPNTLTLQIKAFNADGNLNGAQAKANEIGAKFSDMGFIFIPITLSDVASGQENRIEIKLVGSIDVAESCCGPQVAPGHVMIVPISSFKSRNAIDPLRPKTSRRTLLEIEEYLKKRSSPFVRIHAKNPIYEQVLTFFCVKFYVGVDKGFYLKQLNEEIVQFLTPWAFEAGADVKFDQKIYASSIIKFIEDRPYVDFIKDFFMGVCKVECCPTSHEFTTEALDEFSSTIEGNVYDKRTGKAIQAAMVRIEHTDHSTMTDSEGAFKFESIDDKSIVSIVKEGYEREAQEVNVSSFSKFYLNTDETVEEKFSRFCGCQDVEKELTNADFLGDTVIVPSTNRSILVSAPKHLIIPCEDEIEPDACAERKNKFQTVTVQPFESLQAIKQENLEFMLDTEGPIQPTEKLAVKSSDLKASASVKKTEAESTLSTPLELPKLSAAKNSPPSLAKKATGVKKAPSKKATSKAHTVKAKAKKTVSKASSNKVTPKKKPSSQSKSKKV